MQVTPRCRPAPRRCQLLQEKSRTVVVTARSSRTTKNSSGRRLFSERTCCARSGVWSISELKVARMLEICQSLFVERSAERCVAVMRSCRRSPAWARPRCLFWPACNRLAWLSVCGPPLPARDDSPPPDTSVCPPLQVDSSEKACHSRCCLSEASLRASCGPI